MEVLPPHALDQHNFGYPPKKLTGVPPRFAGSAGILISKDATHFPFNFSRMAYSPDFLSVYTPEETAKAIADAYLSYDPSGRPSWPTDDDLKWVFLNVKTEWERLLWVTRPLRPQPIPRLIALRPRLDAIAATADK